MRRRNSARSGFALLRACARAHSWNARGQDGPRPQGQATQTPRRCCLRFRLRLLRLMLRRRRWRQEVVTGSWPGRRWRLPHRRKAHRRLPHRRKAHRRLPHRRKQRVWSRIEQSSSCLAPRPAVGWRTRRRRRRHASEMERWLARSIAPGRSGRGTGVSTAPGRLRRRTNDRRAGRPPPATSAVGRAAGVRSAKSTLGLAAACSKPRPPRPRRWRPPQPHRIRWPHRRRWTRRHFAASSCGRACRSDSAGRSGCPREGRRSGALHNRASSEGGPACPACPACPAGCAPAAAG